MLESLFGNTSVLQTALTGLAARQQALAENVANADTPGYKRLEVSYEQQLAAEIGAGSNADEALPLKTDNARQFTLGPAGKLGARPVVTTVSGESFRNDGNNVDIEEQMANMAQTNIRYNTMASLVQRNFERLKDTLKEIN